MRGDASYMRGDASYMRGDASYMRGDASYMRGDASYMRGDASYISRMTQGGSARRPSPRLRAGLYVSSPAGMSGSYVINDGK
jgi:hypothetical protein